MKFEDRVKIFEENFKETQHIGETKGKSYAGHAVTADTLSNFKRAAEKAGITKYRAWSVFVNKHLDAIDNSIKNIQPDDTIGIPIEVSEGLHSRIIDSIVFLNLLDCMIIEDINSLKADLVDKYKSLHFKKDFKSFSEENIKEVLLQFFQGGIDLSKSEINDKIEIILNMLKPWK